METVRETCGNVMRNGRKRFRKTGKHNIEEIAMIITGETKRVDFYNLTYI